MAELFLAFAGRDRDRVGFIVQGLQKAGFAINTGFDESGAPAKRETMALAVKRSEAFIPLLTGASGTAEEFRSMLRAGLLYAKPLVAARLEQVVETEPYSQDLPLLNKTRFEGDPGGLTDALKRAVDLHKPDASSGIGFSPTDDDSEQNQDAYLKGSASRPALPDVKRLVDALRANGVTAQSRSSTTANVDDAIARDGRGLPKNTDSMAVHWRMIAKDGSAAALRQFASEYQEDPYFSTIAKEAAQKIYKKKMMRGALIGVDSVFGMIVAGAFFYVITGYCLDNGCSDANLGATNAGLIQTTQPGGGAVVRQQLQQAQDAISALHTQLETVMRQNNSFGQQLQTARQQVDQATRQANAAQSAQRKAENQVLALSQILARQDAQIAEQERTLRGAAQPESRPVSPSTDDLGGAKRLLVYFREQLAVRASNRRQRAVLTRGDLAALQRCILRHTGALAKIDGAWGLETTDALFAINDEEAGWIIDCLRGR
jgi:hypothetical protein